MTNQRENVPSWDETFMNIAKIVAKRSKDPVTQVGACVVSEDRRILSIGYNGAPNGFKDSAFPWGKHSSNILENKYLYVVHAERNAILNFRGLLREFQNSTLYVTLFPCNECAKEIIQSGIKKVIYESCKNDEYSKASKIMFKETGVDCLKFHKV